MNQQNVSYHLVLELTLQDVRLMRVFKTRWFSKAAKSHAVHDSELCKTVKAVMQGKADDLGGGVFKKRLNHNRDRDIILAKGGKHWYYTYLYAKQDKANIDHDN